MLEADCDSDLSAETDQALELQRVQGEGLSVQLGGHA